MSTAKTGIQPPYENTRSTQGRVAAVRGRTKLSCRPTDTWGSYIKGILQDSGKSWESRGAGRMPRRRAGPRRGLRDGYGRMGSDRAERKRILEAVRGDQGAFGELFKRHHGQLVGFLWTLTHDHALACDLAQDTFVRAYLGIHKLKNPDGFRSWLHRIALHAAIDWKRREPVGSVALDGSDDPVLGITSDKDSEDSPTRSEALRQEVRTLVKQLPEAYALLVFLHYYGELSCKEIAVVTRLSVANVKIRLFRARKALRCALNGMVVHGV